ncbi:Pom34p KNAG_0M01730 [Huiozyma naganishii CBS 8797]|uniref:Nucleoporin POM34 n=1 Tax=Huiozyma naganishii (strain ATCC MYA-139 / BCRC 22969 / CBS 8797 / KCTC 17520 / NBRC 10181 / NCYC 3082 / Yp74L-3) TaxID=1071383 RepID=J7SBG5_HUIN7|nr:hypothetical protein KNAG_0M01730 [Kazachstania naganishii CBS 8797]CCK73026.1 hypothetical protein KNAG_0M01730 [Kazachstania naganishii CBS 8797]
MEETGPSRPLSRDQMQTLRMRVVEESPRLYRDNLLSDPVSQVVQQQKLHQQQQQQKQTVRKMDAPAETVGAAGFRSANLGSFENPVLDKVISRTINKESEFQVVVTNVLIFFLWNLLYKSTQLLLEHSAYGRKLSKQCMQTLWSLQRAHPRWGPLWQLFQDASVVKADYLNHLVGIVLGFNIVTALFKLRSRINTRDLELTQRQRELLGLDPRNHPQGDTKGGHITKPHVVISSSNTDRSAQNSRLSRDSQSSAGSTGSAQQSPPPTPFLFKSLQTPLKSKQTDAKQQQTPHLPHTKVSAFGNNPLTTDRKQQVRFPFQETGQGTGVASSTASMADHLPKTPNLTANKGYIPSSKYSYMMNSPSPMKSL